MRTDPFDPNLKERLAALFQQSNACIEKRQYPDALRLLDDILGEVPNLDRRSDWLYKTFCDRVEFTTAYIRWLSGQLPYDRMQYGQLRWLELPISEAHRARASIWVAENRLPEAIQDLEAAIEWNPIHAGYYFELGDIYRRRLKNPQRALELYSKGLQNTYQKPVLARGYRGAGAALLDLGDVVAAEAAYRKSLHLEPRNRAAKAQLARISASKPAADETAESYDPALVSKGIPTTVHPSFVQALSTLGQNCLQQGLFQQAVEYYQHVIESDPRSASAHVQLALAYTQLNEPGQARKHQAIAHEIAGAQ